MPGPEAAPANRGWIELIVSYLFPRRCLFCKDILPLAGIKPLCSSCLPYYKPGGRICPFCEGFFREEKPCSCRLDDIPLQGLFVIALYDSRWRRLVHDLKYRNRKAVLRPLGDWLASEINRAGYCRPDLAVPVPLHPAREKERGYNQSALLARHTARALNIPCRSILVKEKQTLSQTSITRRERRENIRGAFRCLPGAYKQTTVLLVDDVYSTGSTMKEAASALSLQGARVFGAALAYNPNYRALQGSGFYAGLDKW